MSRSAFVFKVVEFESPPVFDSDLSSIHPHQVVMNKWVIVMVFPIKHFCFRTPRNAMCSGR